MSDDKYFSDPTHERSINFPTLGQLCVMADAHAELAYMFCEAFERFRPPFAEAEGKMRIETNDDLRELLRESRCRSNEIVQGICRLLEIGPLPTDAEYDPEADEDRRTLFAYGAMRRKQLDLWPRPSLPFDQELRQQFEQRIVVRVAMAKYG